MWLSTARGWVKLEEAVLQGVIQLHDSRLVATSVAVVGSREDGHNIPIV